MRRTLLDAAVDCLCENGYERTTTTDVQRRAGVSRGGLLHHFSSRSELMLSAVEHLSVERIAALLSALRASPPENDRLEWAISLLWSSFQGRLYQAALELWLAARHDDNLRNMLIPQERVIGQAIRSMGASLFGPEIADHNRFPQALEILLDAQRGAAARSILFSTDLNERLVASWAIMVRSVITYSHA